MIRVWRRSRGWWGVPRGGASRGEDCGEDCGEDWLKRKFWGSRGKLAQEEVFALGLLLYTYTKLVKFFTTYT